MDFFRIVKSTALRNYRINKRAFPISFMLQRVISGIISVVLPIAVFYLLFDKQLSNEFLKYSGTSDYVT